MRNRTNLLINLFKRLHGSISPSGLSDRTMLLFAFEGVLIALVNNLIGNNNYLFATRLGASDFQISLVGSLPQLVGMLVLIPGGILTDRMTNKRRMVIINLIFLASAFFLIGFTPIFGQYRLAFFIVMLALSMGPMTLYNASWQAYFSDVVVLEERNRTFTLRTRGTFIVSIVTPLATGLLLSSIPGISGKIKLHQIFFWVACLMLILQVFVLKRIQGGNVQSHRGITFKDLRTAAFDLAHNKRFIGFVGVAMFFYITWQSDWTLYYLGMFNYLKLNEAWLSYVSVGAAVIQLLTIGFWSRMNERLGIRFTIIMGSLGLVCNPLCMILATSMPVKSGQIIFLVLNSLASFAFATVILNMLQCLLQVIPEKNKTLSIAIYTVLITLSNAVMPVVGVQVYTAFGADLSALQITFWIIFGARIISTGLWTVRWWLLRSEPKL